jgi:hypothetical protein
MSRDRPPLYREGARVRIRDTEAVRAKEAMRAHIGAEAVVLRPPVHPNTWYVLRMNDGVEVKLRSSCFDAIPRAGARPTNPSNNNNGTGHMASQQQQHHTPQRVQQQQQQQHQGGAHGHGHGSGQRTPSRPNTNNASRHINGSGHGHAHHGNVGTAGNNNNNMNHMNSNMNNMGGGNHTTGSALSASQSLSNALAANGSPFGYLPFDTSLLQAHAQAEEAHRIASAAGLSLQPFGNNNNNNNNNNGMGGGGNTAAQLAGIAGMMSGLTTPPGSPQAQLAALMQAANNPFYGIYQQAAQANGAASLAQAAAALGLNQSTPQSPLGGIAASMRNMNGLNAASAAANMAGVQAMNNASAQLAALYGAAMYNPMFSALLSNSGLAGNNGMAALGNMGLGMGMSLGSPAPDARTPLGGIDARTPLSTNPMPFVSESPGGGLLSGIVAPNSMPTTLIPPTSQLTPTTSGSGTGITNNAMNNNSINTNNMNNSGSNGSNSNMNGVSSTPSLSATGTTTNTTSGGRVDGVTSIVNGLGLHTPLGGLPFGMGLPSFAPSPLGGGLSPLVSPRFILPFSPSPSPGAGSPVFTAPPSLSAFVSSPFSSHAINAALNGSGITNISTSGGGAGSNMSGNGLNGSPRVPIAGWRKRKETTSSPIDNSIINNNSNSSTATSSMTASSSQITDGSDEDGRRLRLKEDKVDGASPPAISVPLSSRSMMTSLSSSNSNDAASILATLHSSPPPTTAARSLNSAAGIAAANAANVMNASHQQALANAAALAAANSASSPLAISATRSSSSPSALSSGNGNGNGHVIMTSLSQTESSLPLSSTSVVLAS